ncbi:hypothetical protein QAD02_018735 [Eretmocerus hayati]|uniref:Uncharacterized protein n=1 Tax=Eretmocerus hayati TaxID=131215 RepID=A0ACC2PHK3_9HYME|nr:hypothetical protein QAD02_018735 [Eretmocerus hayati]
MIRIILFVTFVYHVTVKCSAYTVPKTLYRNLYGFEINRTPANEALLNLTIGALKFMRENEKFAHSGLQDTTPEPNEEYDFIVIGAGSAGATIASRLSEIPEVTVLLIEAGRNENLMMDIPLIVNYLQLSEEINWMYQTVPSDKYCLGMVGHKCNFPRGKVVGGSSVLNYMIATRGDPKDYDEWAAMGNKEWSYKQVLKYFKKLESMDVEELKSDSEMHNTKGPVHIGYAPYHTPLAQSFVEAGAQMGYPIVDYNGEQMIGFSIVQSTIKNGTRMSSNRAYLHPFRRRKNLFLSKLSHVDKILIDPRSKRAYGVEFTKANVSIQVKARKEVILSAGAIGSPQILMLSGIGPRKHLTDMNIQVIQDAPVGENLMDHISYGGLVFFVDQPVSMTMDEVSNPMKPYLRDFLNEKEGPFTSPGGCEGLGFINVDHPKETNYSADIEFMFLAGSVVSDSILQFTFGISDDYWNAMFSNITGRHSWTIFPMLMKPLSRGRILLQNKNPETKPKIYPNYFENPDDMRVMIKGIRAAIELSKTEAMQRFGSELYDTPVPGCENYVHDSDDYWECAARTFSFTIYHYSGTCKMGPLDDPTSVVDPKLKVKGVKGLRVADASIMPVINVGHTNIPSIMIGEKAADMIKEDWGLSVKEG